MHRIFIAINLPEGIRKGLENLEKEISGLFPEEFSGGVVRWVKKDNLHLTLFFIGSIPDGQVPQVCEIVKKIAQSQEPFSLSFKKVCYGPPRKMPPRMIWLELDRSPELLNLAEELKKGIGESGLLRRMEARPFSPHITLGRIRTWQWKRIEPEERPEIDREISLAFEVKSIEVMESRLKRTGAEYTILKSFNL